MLQPAKLTPSFAAALRAARILGVLAFGLAGTSGCVTKGHRTAKAKAPPAGLSMTEVADDQPLPKAKAKNDATPKGAAPLSPAAIKGCERVVRQVVTTHKNLFMMLPQGSYAPTGGYLDTLLATDVGICQDPARRTPALTAVKDSISRHSSRVGIILPLSGPQAKMSAFIVNGMRAAFQEAGLDFDKAAILKDSAGDPKTAELRLAELVFKDRPALVIGGLDTAEADVLSKYAGPLLLPTVILSRDRDLAQRSTFVFNVYPDEKRLAETLAATAAKRGIKRFAILKPQSGKSDKVTQFFREAIQQSGATVVQELTYVPNNFDSMQGVARQLFKTEAADRLDEYRQAYRKARQRAQAEHVPFDPRMVVLKPIVDFDALFLPDDFRMARHFAKLFEFYQVEKLVMIGNHEWRSPALVEPFDPFLEGSFFADFIGSYDQIPPGVSAPTVGSPYFVHPQNVVMVDFQLIGYRVARTARMVLKAPPASRTGVNDALRAVVSDSAAFFGTGKVFDTERQNNWPTYLFNVSKGQLLLDAQPITAAR